MHNSIEVNGIRVERFPELRGTGGNCVVTDLATGEKPYRDDGGMKEKMREIARHLGMSPDGRLFDRRNVELNTHSYADAVIAKFYNLGDGAWNSAAPLKRKPRRGLVGGRR